jgi:hypothetical protein
MDQLVVYESGEAKPGFDGARTIVAGPDFPYFGTTAAQKSSAEGHPVEIA